MKLTERQSDALFELINIAFARTGAALSELTGRRVVLNPPEVAVYRTEELRPALAKFVPEMWPRFIRCLQDQSLVMRC